MKSVLPIVGLFVGVVVASLAGVGLGRTCFSACGPVQTATAPANVEDVGWLTRTLGLSAEQTAAVTALQKEYRGNLSSSCAAQCAARAKMRDMLLKTDADAAKTRELVEAMAKAQVESDLATVTHLRGICRLLTPPQQRIFEDRVLNCVCGTCPTGLHACDMPGKAAPAGTPEPPDPISHQ